MAVGPRGVSDAGPGEGIPVPPPVAWARDRGDTVGMPKPIRVIGSDELVDADPTAGMRRRAAIDVDGLWAGLVHTEAGAVSGWHHHGDHETSLYVVTGTMRMEFGPKGASAVDAGPGEFIHVPAHAVHRESNPTDKSSTAVIARAGAGAPTVNVDGPEHT